MKQPCGSFPFHQHEFLLLLGLLLPGSCDHAGTTGQHPSASAPVFSEAGIPQNPPLPEDEESHLPEEGPGGELATPSVLDEAPEALLDESNDLGVTETEETLDTTAPDPIDPKDPGKSEVDDGAVDQDEVDNFNVLIVGWDGVQRNHLEDCRLKKLNGCSAGLPTLRRIAGDRVYDLITANGATETKPGWAQLLTGYNAEVTGVLSNENYQPIPKGYTLFEKVEQHLGPEKVKTLFIAAKLAHVGATCAGEEGEKHGQPWCLTRAQLDQYENGLGSGENVIARALELLELHGKARFLAFIHFQDPDHEGHNHGENSAGYTKALVDVDRWTGQLLDMLENLGVLQRTLVYLVTDHGFDEGKTSHKNAPFGFLASSDSWVTRHADRRDLTPTILERYGISVAKSQNTPPCDGHSLGQALSKACIEEGGAILEPDLGQACCPGLALTMFDRYVSTAGACFEATGGRRLKTGWCTKRKDAVCTKPENRCNCAVDCPAP